MRGLRALLAVTLAAGATGAAQSDPSAAAQPDRVTFAVLRRDGVITPFAQWRDRRWRAPWPAALAGKWLPVNLEAVPDHWWGGDRPEPRWRTWLIDGQEGTLTLQAPAPYAVHCARRMGIRTDYRAAQPLPPAPTQPFPKDGLAASDAVKLERVEIVPRSSEAWPALAVALLSEFDRVEDTAISAIANVTGWRHPARRQDRRQLAVRLESWYRVPLEGGASASYIEAVRSYAPRAEDEGCGLETFFSGWVFQPAGGSRPGSSLRAKVTYCDRVGANYMLPLGIFRAEGRVHWLYQLSGWEDEWYVVADVREGSARIVAEYHAGGAGSCG